MIHARESGSPGDSEETALSAFNIGLIRTLVLRLGNVDVAEQVAERAGGRGHDVRAVDLSDECYWLAATGSVDLLLVTVNPPNIAVVASLIERLRNEAPVEAMHFMVILEGNPGNVLEGLVAAGADDFLLWPGDAVLLNARLQLAEEALTRRESGFRTAADWKRAAANLEGAFHAMPHGLLIVSNPDGRIHEANKTVATVLGYERAMLKGRYVTFLFPELFQNQSGSFSRGDWMQRCEPVEVRYRHPQSGRRFLELQALEIPWGGAQRWMIRIADVQARHEVEQEYINAHKAESVRLLAGGVARDLNDALTAISGNVALLGQEPFLTPEAGHLLNRAEAASERVRDLSDKLAMLSRESESTKGLRNLGRILKREAHFALFGGNTRPEFNIPDDFWPAYCDEKEIGDVVRELVKNADQAVASQSRPGRLFVTGTNLSVPEGTRLPLAPGDYVRVAFKDEGAGIRGEDIRRIFDPYFTTRPGSAGLGLAMAAAIIKNHRGCLRAESMPGEGALFEFYLPALSDPSVLEHLEQDARDGDEVPPCDRRGARVLFMDDEAEIREIAARILGRYGFEVYCAGDGREAIAIYEQALEFGSPFDVLLFDLGVRGGLGGREAIQHLRSKYPHLRALVSTNDSDERVLEHLREAGFSGVLTKPFRIEKLVSAVTRLAQGGNG